MLGKKILEYTKKKKLSIRQFAITAGLDNAQVSRYVHGKSAPTERTVKKILEVYPDFDEVINGDTTPNLKVINDSLRAALKAEMDLNNTLKKTIAAQEVAIKSLQDQIKSMQTKPVK